MDPAGNRSTHRMVALIASHSLTSVLVCATAIVAAFVCAPWLRDAAGLEAFASVEYGVGDQFDLISLSASVSPAAVIFARGNCSACQQSEGSLRSLVAELRVLERPVVVAVPLSVRDDDRRFAQRLGIGPEFVVRVPLKALRAFMVPTVLIVGPDRIVRYVHHGTVTSTHVTGMLHAARR